MVKNKKLPSVIVLMILTVITILFWISFSVYKVFTNNEPLSVPEKVIEPLNPNLDMRTLNEIENRKQ